MIALQSILTLTPKLTLPSNTLLRPRYNRRRP
ncbi:MAG: Uncharacterised protein [Formosa sp. Hel3_A1_48]|nr:MAG: Uncharacterised protein [Formosa sp. Hel3_A1_48]